jgi:hypothetical protein
MLGIEPRLVELVSIQLARLQCPINVTSGLQLANSLIAGTPIAEQLVKWKIMHNVQTRCDISLLAPPGTARTVDTTTPTNDIVVSSDHGSMSAASSPLLGWGYWSGFMKRNGHVIKCKRAVKFEAKRLECCTYKISNVCMMAFITKRLGV